MFKKIVSTLLMSAMTVTLLAGCGSEKEAGNAEQTKETDAVQSVAQDVDAADEIDISEEVTLKMILLGSKPEDFDLVYEKVNEILKEQVNATLDVEFYDWGDWQQKYPLAFASGEKFDLIYTSSWAFYSEQAVKGGFLELTDDMLEKYAPESYSRITEDQWKQTRINDKIYMIPYTNKEASSELSIMVRGDLREKHNIPEVTDEASYLNYLDVIAENETDVFGYAAGGSDGTGFLLTLMEYGKYGKKSIGMNGNYFGYYIDMEATEESGKPVITHVTEDEELMDAFKLMASLREKGVWSQNAMSNATTVDEAFENGISASYIKGPLSIAQEYAKVNALHPEWKLEIVDIRKDNPNYCNTVLSNGMAVHATSENPERALMVLDLLRYNKEINDLTTLGIEGVHWSAVGDTQFESLEASTKFAPDSGCPWGWRTELYRTNITYPQAAVEALDKLQTEGYTPQALMFSFNSESVKTELAAISTIAGEYYPVLKNGFAEDVEGTWAEFLEKANAAGLETVMAEYMKQLEAFMAED